MPKFINPFTDVGFKRIFGQEINKDLLIDFLNSLLDGERRVNDIRFLDKELLPAYAKDRSLIYDVYCTDDNGEQFIVEMQNREHVNFRERTLYYLSQAISRQGEKGVDWSFDLKAVYGVFFLNFNLAGLPRKLRTDIVLCDRDTHEPFSDKMRYIFIELPSFVKAEGDCENDFERWIYVLKNMETLQRLPFKARKAVFEKLEEIVDIASMSKEDRLKYDESIKVYRDRMAIMAFERKQGFAEGMEKGMAQGMAEGIAQGIAEGMKKGKAEGIAEGMEKGKAEGIAEGMEKGKAEGIAEGMEKGQEQERLKNARAMKAAGLAPGLISQITGLTLETVEAL